MLDALLTELIRSRLIAHMGLQEDNLGLNVLCFLLAESQQKTQHIQSTSAEGARKEEMHKPGIANR
jgi:hypothetical protein